MPEPSSSGPLSPTIRRLVGVYDADGTLRGELTYWVGARFGTAHCGLCDITHGLVSERSDWKVCRGELPVPFDTYHRDDQPDSVRAASVTLPVVVAETDDGVVVLLGSEELDRCKGSVERFAAALGEAIAAKGLEYPG